MKFLELFIDALVVWVAAYFVGKMLLNKNDKMTIFKIITIFIFSVTLACLNMINFEIFHGIIKIIGTYFIQCLFYKIVFKQTYSKSIVIALIWYLCLFVSEVLIALLATLLLHAMNQSLVFLKNSIIINCLIASLNVIIINLSKNKLISFINNTHFNVKSSLIIIIIILITLALLVFRIPVSNWNINVEFIITMMILLCFCLVGLFILKQKADIHQTTSMYQQLVEYSDITNNLLEDYRVVSHEHQNQLSIIRSMIDEQNKELVEYIDNLLEKRHSIKYQWIGELNRLPLSGLKGLINYKLIEMEKVKINPNISISKDITKTKLDKLTTKQKDNLYSIMGVYLDNAIESSKESKKKEVTLEIYKENKDIVFVLANTYSGLIELDKIETYGYTTKGKNHGVGLHLVKKIIDSDNTFSQNRNLFENYYVQELRINLNKISNKKAKK